MLEADRVFDLKDSFGERKGMLLEFTHVAIDFGHLEQARRYANELRIHGRGFCHLWSQYANTYLARLDAADNNLGGVNSKLSRLMVLYQEEPTHAAENKSSLALVNDLLKLGQETAAQKCTCDWNNRSIKTLTTASMVKRNS